MKKLMNIIPTRSHKKTNKTKQKISKDGATQSLPMWQYFNNKMCFGKTGHFCKFFRKTATERQQIPTYQISMLDI